MSESDHPINIIVSKFRLYFSRHYSNQIVMDQKTKDHYLIKEEDKEKFEIKYVTDH